jgi:hypothetical protein
MYGRPLVGKGFLELSANASGAVMYTAFVCGHRPLALMEFADRTPIIPARWKRDDKAAYSDLGS